MDPVVELSKEDEILAALAALRFLVENYGQRTDTLLTDIAVTRNSLEAAQLPSPSGKRTLDIAFNFYLDQAQDDPRLGQVEMIKAVQQKYWPDRFFKGGGGSGNFGHAGRPGEVGGSGPGGSGSAGKTPAYTIAPKYYSGEVQYKEDKYIDDENGKIQHAPGNREGKEIDPTKPLLYKGYWGYSISIGSNVRHGDEDIDFIRIEEVERLQDINSWALVAKHTPLILEKAKVAQAEWAKKQGKPSRYAPAPSPKLKYGTRFKVDKITPTQIHVSTYDNDKLSFVVDREDPKRGKPVSASASKGGPGSGNFGHAGRPGEIGGSAPDDVSPQESLLVSDDIRGLAMMVRKMRADLIATGKKARRETRAILRKPFANILAEARKLPKSDKNRQAIEARVADTISMAEYRVEALLQNEMERNLVRLLGDKYKPVMDRIANMVAFEEAMDDETQIGNIAFSHQLTTTPFDPITTFRMDESWDGVLLDEVEAKKAVASALELRKEMAVDIMAQATKGGAGSGNYGHQGRPGEVGGSGSGGKPTRGRNKGQIMIGGGRGDGMDGEYVGLADSSLTEVEFGFLGYAAETFAQQAGTIDELAGGISEFAGTMGNSITPAVADAVYQGLLLLSEEPPNSVVFVDGNQEEYLASQIDFEKLATLVAYEAYGDDGPPQRAGFLYEKKKSVAKKKKPAPKKDSEEDEDDTEEDDEYSEEDTEEYSEEDYTEEEAPEKPFSKKPTLDRKLPSHKKPAPTARPDRTSRDAADEEAMEEGDEPTTPPPPMGDRARQPAFGQKPATTAPVDAADTNAVSDPNDPLGDMSEEEDDGFGDGLDLDGNDVAGTTQALLESAMHESFSVAADTLYRQGIVDRDERIALSGIGGDVLRIFNALLMGTLGADFLDRPLTKKEEQRIQAPSVPAQPLKMPMRAWAEIASPSVRAASDLYMAAKGISGPTMDQIPPMAYHVLPEEMAIKALGRNRVGGYLCLWGNDRQRDVYKEYFTPKTEERMSVFKAVGALPALYHHAMDNTIRSLVVGLVDTMADDDVGCWIEAQIKEHKAYRQMISPLMEQKVLGWSSGALPGGRRVNKSSGEILRWPVVEASMTHTPAEWRMLAEWPAQNLKSVWTQSGLKGMDSFNRVVQRNELEQEKLALALLELEESL